MLQDLEAWRPLEVEALVGAVLEVASGSPLGPVSFVLIVARRGSRVAVGAWTTARRADTWEEGSRDSYVIDLPRRGPPVTLPRRE